jgi:hypothetical protein
LVREALENFVIEQCKKGPLQISPDGRIRREGGGDSGGD